MIIETDIYPADEPWLSLGYTHDRASSNTNFSGLTDPKIQLSATLAQIDEFFCTATLLESSKAAGRRFR
jgi:hypothetical protein